MTWLIFGFNKGELRENTFKNKISLDIIFIVCKLIHNEGRFYEFTEEAFIVLDEIAFQFDETNKANKLYHAFVR